MRLMDGDDTGLQVLVDLKLSPDVLEVPVPRFFIEDQVQPGG